MCDVLGGQGVPISDVQREPCTVRSNASWVMVAWGHFPVDRQTDTNKNITFPQLRWWAVTRTIHYPFISVKVVCHLNFLLTAVSCDCFIKV